MNFTTEEIAKLHQTELECHIDAIDHCIGRAELDLNGFYTEINEMFLEITSGKRDDVIGKHHSEFVNGKFAASAEYKSFWAELLNGNIQKGGHQYFFNGKEVWVFAIFAPIKGLDGKPRSIMAIFNDISKVREQEQRLKQQASELISQKNDLDTYVNELKAIKTKQEEHEADLEAHLAAIDNSTGRIEMNLDGTIKFVNEKFLKLTKSESSRIIGKHIGFFINEETKQTEGYKNFWANILNGNIQYGGHKYVFDNHDVWFYATYTPVKEKNGEISYVIGLFNDISKVRQQEQTLKNQAEELQAQSEELRQSLEELQTVQEHLELSKIETEGQLNAIDNSLGRVELNLDGTIKSANNFFLSLAGVTFDDIDGSHMSEFMSKEVRRSEGYKRFWPELLSGKVQKGGHQYFFNGREIWVYATFTPVLDNKGNIKSIIFLCHDISKIREQEKALKEQSDELEAQSEELRMNLEEMSTIQNQMEEQKKMMECHLDAIDASIGRAEFNLDGTIIYANDKFMSFSGEQFAKIKGKHISEFFSESVKKSSGYQGFWSKILKGNIQQGGHQYFINGKEVWVFATYAPVKDSKDEISTVIALYNDISKVRQQEFELREQAEELTAQSEELRQYIEELKTTQESLEENKKRFEDLANLLPQTVYETDEKGNIVFMNRNGYKLLGYNEFNKPTELNAIEIVVPEDRERMMKNIKDAITGRESEGNEYLVKTSDGRTIFVLMHSNRIIRDNKVAGLRGVATDVTQLKEAEEKIKAQLKEIEEQKIKIEMQRDLVVTQNNEIVDSINYARRIQNAVLPKELLKNHFTDYFVYYKPKDIVSGDFYWSAAIKDWVLVAVADCTGHGVPGAFMSILGIATLNEILNKNEEVETDKILNELRNNIVKALQQKCIECEQKDGMDIALFAWNKKTNECQFSGANNPLYYILSNKNGNSEPVIERINPDKMPIAIFVDMQSFTKNTFSLKKNDMVYLFSDGYADQFGGAMDKKYNYTRFKTLLTNIHKLPLNDQKHILDEKFYEWKGDHFQVDDICVLGIKL